jgi:hypothetical protein
MFDSKKNEDAAVLFESKIKNQKSKIPSSRAVAADRRASL